MVIAETLKAFSDPVRCEILTMLKSETMNAGDIAKKLHMSPAVLSYHLKILKKAELVVEYKEKNFVCYEINTTLFDELVLWLKQFGGGNDEKQSFMDSVDNSFVGDTGSN